MPAADFRRYRRFYRRVPFGPAWQLMTSWLAGAVARQVHSKKPTTLAEAMKALGGGGRRGRRPRPRPGLKPGFLADIARKMGATNAPALKGK